MVFNHPKKWKNTKNIKKRPKKRVFSDFLKKKCTHFSCYFLINGQKMDISSKTAKIEKPL
jgi:cytochrome b involved in lipid metabolism